MLAEETPIKPDKKVLDMIEAGISDVMSENNYVKRLEEKAILKESKQVLRRISLDLSKHEKMLSQIYNKISGEDPNPKVPEKKVNKNIIEDYEQSIFVSLDRVEFLRQIYFMFLNLEIRDMMYEIVTDTQGHSTMFGYLYSNANFSLKNI